MVGRRPIAVPNRARVGDAVPVVAKIRLVLVDVDGLKRAVEAHDLAHAVVGLEPRKPPPGLGAHAHARRRLVKEARGSPDSAISA